MANDTAGSIETSLITRGGWGHNWPSRCYISPPPPKQICQKLVWVSGATTLTPPPTPRCIPAVCGKFSDKYSS